MPVIISESELRPLLESAEETVNAIDAVEQLLVDIHSGEPGATLFADMPIDGGNTFKLYGVTKPGAATLRVFPGETQRGSAKDASFILVLDPETGGLDAILTGNAVNTLRTAVPCGVGARYLAPEHTNVICVLGSGSQARSHARILTSALPQATEVVVWSPTKENREAFAKEQTEILGITVRPCETAAEAVAAGDVITAAGLLRGGEAGYEAGWVKPGALCISMTGSAPRELYGMGAQLVMPTTNRPEALFIGFVGQQKPSPRPDPEGLLELGDVIAGKVKSRKSPDQTVIFELANVYPWDHAIVDWARGWAEANGKGTEVSFE